MNGSRLLAYLQQCNCFPAMPHKLNAAFALRPQCANKSPKFMKIFFTLVGASPCSRCSQERQHGGCRMKDCLVDVLDARGTVLHVFPVPVEDQDGASKAVDPEQEALRLAVLEHLVPEAEAGTLQARKHISRGGPLTPYSDVLEVHLQKLQRIEQRIRERAYFLWQQAGCFEDRTDEYWHRACETEGKF